MFSSRLNWDSTHNPLLQQLAAKRAAGIEVLDLTESNPTCVGFTYDHDLILRALAQPASTSYQPSPQGLPSARAGVADYYRDRGQPIDPAMLLLTTSTSEAYAFLFKLLCNPGDEVLIPQPGYPLFEFLTALESVRPISYPLSFSEDVGWRINFERLDAAIGERTRAIIVVSPHNPTGSCLTQAELAELNRLCQLHRLALIVDEVFADYRAPESLNAGRQLPEASESVFNNTGTLTFVLNGLSKVVGLPQAKLGWIFVSGPETERQLALAHLEFIADTYLSVSAAVQLAAPLLLARRENIQTQIRQRLDANDAWLQTQSGGRRLPRQGGWYAVLEFQDTISDEMRAQQALELDNVFVHPGYFYDFAREGYIVASLLTPTNQFQAGIGRLLDPMGLKQP